MRKREKTEEVYIQGGGLISHCTNRTFVGSLMDLGFNLNKYDACVANKDIQGSQCTVCWYVDNNKISHKVPRVVDQIICELEKRFGKMTVTREKLHNFVGMDIVFRDDCKFEISMRQYLEESVEVFPETITQTA